MGCHCFVLTSEWLEHLKTYFMAKSAADVSVFHEMNDFFYKKGVLFRIPSHLWKVSEGGIIKDLIKSLDEVKKFSINSKLRPILFHNLE